jgi:DNA-binding NtrC family response regulator
MDDLPFLAAKFLSEAAALYKVTEKKLSAKATEKMLTHVWPGNIRELRNVVYKAVILAESNLITEKEIDFEVANGINLGKNSRPEITAEKLRAAIAECSGNMSKVAEKLGISRVTLYKKLKKFNISDSK